MRKYNSYYQISAERLVLTYKSVRKDISYHRFSAGRQLIPPTQFGKTTLTTEPLQKDNSRFKLDAERQLLGRTHGPYTFVVECYKSRLRRRSRRRERYRIIDSVQLHCKVGKCATILQ